MTPTAEPFEVLLLEDDPISRASTSRVIMRAVPQATLLLATTVAEGRTVLSTHKPQLCVLDIQLPDGSGIDFIYDVQEHAPAATVAMLTGVPLPLYRDLTEAYGVLHFMEKPATSHNLGEITRSLWEKWNQTRGGAAPETGGFSAMLTQLTTLDIIQLKCLGRASVTLEFVGERGERGRIYFQKGEIIHAESGNVCGVEAFNEIVGWRTGRVQEVSGEKIQTGSLQGNWQTLLMNAVHWVDEQKAA